MYAKGDQLPVVTDVNLINPIGTLADGRPIYSTAVNAATRLDPRFNHINEVQSIGDSTFKSMTLQATKRFAQGLTFNVQYSLGKGLDNTPLLTQLTVQAEAGRSDPSNLDRDLGPNPLDMRHNFTGNIVYTSTNHSSDNAFVRGAAQRQPDRRAAAVQQRPAGQHSGEPRPERRRRRRSDRPLVVARNSLYLPTRKNVDLRYTRMDPDSRVGARRSDRGAEERVQHRAAVELHDDDRRSTRPATR